MKLWAIPDIHGRADLLNHLLATLRSQENLNLGVDKLIFLGDMIDRGPDSAGVLKTVMDLQKESPKNVVVLAGNHEHLCTNAYEKGRMGYFIHWYANGGRATEDSFPGMAVPGDILKWMTELPVQHEEPGFFFSHAPVPIEAYRHSTNHGKPFTVSELTWTYHEPEDTSARDFGDKVGVCGHVHRLGWGVKEPRLYPHYIFADAGCGCSDDAPLVAIEVRSRKVVYAHPEKRK